MKKSTTMLANTLVTGALVMQGAIGNAQRGPSAASNEAIRPFHVNIPEEQLTDLKTPHPGNPMAQPRDRKR